MRSTQRQFLSLSLLSLLSLPLLASADWTVDNDHSQLSFVSVKAGTVAEVHHFGSLNGWLGDDGRFRLEIDLSSVETLIPIRNERMRELLFDVEQFPQATLEAQLDLSPLKALEVGAQTEMVTEAELGLHGKTTGLTIRTVVARLAGDTLLVTSAEPLVLNADALGLTAGVERLREIAGLPSISPAVPVSFRLTLREDPAQAHAVSSR